MGNVAQVRSDRHLWWARVTAILWFLAGTAFLLSVPIVMQASLWIMVGISIVAAVLAGATAFLVMRLRGGKVRGRWIKGTIALVFVLTAVAASPVYYAATLTQVSPAMVPQAVLSNWPNLGAASTSLMALLTSRGCWRSCKRPICCAAIWMRKRDNQDESPVCRDWRRA